MSVLSYLFITFVVLIIASIRLYYKNYTYTSATCTKNLDISTSTNNRIPMVKSIIISVILANYSAYLATSGVLVDASRYAWSFLFRYPQYYGSITTLINAPTEPGFLIVNMLVSKLTDNPFWLFLLIASITTFINIYCMFKLDKKYVVLILLYLISMYYFQTTYLLKQTLAVSFGNLAILAILQNRRKGYVIYSLIALTFHSTAIILLPMYFLFKIRNYKKAYVNSFIIFLVLFLGFSPVINNILPNIPYVNQYLNIENTTLVTSDGSFATILKGVPYYIITVFGFIKIKQLNRNMKNANVFIIFSLLYSMSWLLTYNFYWSFRIGWYFLFPTIILTSNLIKNITNKNEKMLGAIIIYTSLVIVTIRQIIITLM